jgi:2-amino-4-hydroxy-6-hydroxymethyldihydropteridine diphosphokinase
LTTGYVALGGNEGDRLANLERAVRELSTRFAVTARSPLYETEPVGFADQPWFLNAVIAIETDRTPHALLRELQWVERMLGKATPFANGPRTLDLDLLLYGDTVIDEPGLQVPHPRMHERGFVLTPLADIASDFLHPALKRTIGDLANTVEDASDVVPFWPHSEDFPAHIRSLSAS